MKKETFELASVLNTKIEDLDSAIKNIESGKKHACNGAMPINLTFCFDEEYDELKKHVIQHLKAKKAKYEKQFEQLK